MTDDWAKRVAEEVYGGDIERFKQFEIGLVFIDPNNSFDTSLQFLDNVTTDNSVGIFINTLSDNEIERDIRMLNDGYEKIENILVFGTGEHIANAKKIKEKMPYEKLPNIKVIKYIDNDGGGLNTQATEILMSKLIPEA